MSFALHSFFNILLLNFGMTVRLFIVLLLIYINLEYVPGVYQKPQQYEIYMPDVRPTRPDEYLCTPVKISSQKSYYIVGFEPKASMHTVHHMILYGCRRPGFKKSVWNCGEMVSHQEGKVATPCANQTTIIYAWARDAPKLELPEGVAFKIGKNSNINFLVLQVHYNNVDHFKDGSLDRSGLFLNFVETPMPREAGVLLLGAMGKIGKNTLESMETECTIHEDKVVHPFAFRVHTHELGVRVTGYRIRRLKNNQVIWSQIGERDPQLPQMFYPINNDMIIRRNDIVAAACKIDATARNRTTYVGTTSDDEMCNFYMMYWVEDGGPLEEQYCFTSGPPFYYWNMNLVNIPLKERVQYRRNEDPRN